MARSEQWPDICEVKQLLDVYNVPICAHLSLGHKFVLRAYRPDEKTFKDRCSYCDTSFQFRLAFCGSESAMPRTHCLDIFVSRYLGTLQRRTNPTWLSQLSVSKEPDLTNYWLSCIILSWDTEVDKRECIRGNASCGDRGCRFKAETQDSENRLRAQNRNMRCEIDWSSGRLLQESLLSNRLDYALSLKDKILYKPLWVTPGTTWYEAQLTSLFRGNRILINNE